MQRADPIKRGDDVTIPLVFEDENEAAIDITGYTVFYALKRQATNDLDDSEAVLTKTITSHDDAANGSSSVVLTDTELQNIKPDEYLCEIQTKDDGGLIESWPTFIQEIEPDINRRTS